MDRETYCRQLGERADKMLEFLKDDTVRQAWDNLVRKLYEDAISPDDILSLMSQAEYSFAKKKWQLRATRVQTVVAGSGGSGPAPIAAVMIATEKPCDGCKRKMHKSPLKVDKWYCAFCKKYKD